MWVRLGIGVEPPFVLRPLPQLLPFAIFTPFGSAPLSARWAERDCGSSRVFAHFLASLYNGFRVKADVSDIGVLDPESFEHLMNVMRLCSMTQREPHTFRAPL